MSFRRGHSTFRRAAWLAVAALLLQALIPALHHPAGMALAGALDLGGTHNLCIAPGSTPAQPGAPDRAPHGHLPACAICQAVHAIGGFAPTAAITVAAGDVAAVAFTPTEPKAVSFRPAYASQQPRAPPALA